MKEFILLVILILVAALVVVPALGDPALSLDEAQRTIQEATQRAYAANATAQAHAQGTAAVIAAEANGTAQAMFQQAAAGTQQAEATQAGLALVATAGMMTAQADQATATAVTGQQFATSTAIAQATQDTIYNQAMATAQFAQAQTIEDQAQKSALELERARMTNRLLAYLPYSALAIVVIIGLWVYWRERGIRTIARDVNGDAPLVYDVSTGGLFDPDRTPGPHTPTHAGGKALPAPTFTPADLRAAVERDQMTDLARAFARMAGGQPAAVMDWLKAYQTPAENAWKLLGQNPASLVEIVEPGDPRYNTLRPILEDVTQQMEQA